MIIPKLSGRRKSTVEYHRYSLFDKTRMKIEKINARRIEQARIRMIDEIVCFLFFLSNVCVHRTEYYLTKSHLSTLSVFLLNRMKLLHWELT